MEEVNECLIGNVVSSAGIIRIRFLGIISVLSRTPLTDTFKVGRISNNYQESNIGYLFKKIHKSIVL